MVSPSPIQHVVIIVKENHSFDNYVGAFPGANGVVHVRFGGERLVFLGNQDPASYPTGNTMSG